MDGGNERSYHKILFQSLSVCDRNTSFGAKGLIIDSKHLRDQQGITNAFNNYVSSVIDKISKKMLIT